MAYKVLPDGTILAETAAAAVELSKLLQASGGVKPAGKVIEGSGNLGVGRADQNDLVRNLSEWVIPSAIKFLTTIQASSPPGANAAMIMEAIEIDNPKAFGGRSAAINKLIEALGFNQLHVYESFKTANGRIWKAKSKIGEALTALKAMTPQG